MSDLTETVIQEVLEVVPALELSKENGSENLFELGMDSLDHATVLLALEEKLGCKFPDEDVDGLVSVDAIVAHIESQQAA